MTIVWSESKRKLKDIKDYEKNPRKMGNDAFGKLVESVKQDGYHSRIMINEDGTIIGGHQRKRALLKSGMKQSDEVEVLVPDRQLTEEEFNRLNIRDNLPYGEFDFDILADNFDIEQLVEWGMPEAWLTDSSQEEEETKYDTDEGEIPDLPEEPTTRRGDIWVLGQHRLMCGDSVSIDDVDKLLNKAPVDCVYTDPPYGISIVKKDGTVGGGPKTNIYHPIIGDNSTKTAEDAYNLCKSLNVPIMIFWGANHYCQFLDGSPCWIVWDKKNGGMSFADAELAWTNQKTAVRIFSHMWNGYVKDSEREEKRCHPTQKPAALALWCFDGYAAKAKNILDLFGGSGSTLLACEKSGRSCFMMELSPAYCDVIIARWERLTGKKAILELETENVS
jgi:16S rRNA G966 N2-methylase RsmD